MSASFVNGTLRGGLGVALSNMIVDVDTNTPEFPIPNGPPPRRPFSNIQLQ